MLSASSIHAKPRRVESRRAQIGKVSQAFLQGWDCRVPWGGRPKPEPFITAENKGPVLDNRSAPSGAKLVLHERDRRVRCASLNLRGLVKELIRIQILIPQVFIAFAMPGVGSGLRAHVDDAASKLAPLWAKIVVRHLELRNRVLGGNQERQVDVADVQGLTV